MLSYLSNKHDIKSISRELLLSKLFYSSRDKYLSSYEQYKDLEMQRLTTGNCNFFARISEEMLANLKNYKPINFYVIIYIIL